MGSNLLVKLPIFLTALASLPVAAKNPTFRPTSDAPYVEEKMSESGDFSLGVSFSSIVLMGRPYSSRASGTARDFRYQIPTSVGLELGYQLLDNLELGLNMSYMTYESRVDQPAGVGSVAFQTAKYKAYPVVVLARYRFGDPIGWAPEAEGGLGYTFGKFSVRSTNLAAGGTSTSANALMFYASAGAGFAWLEDISLHLNLGYAYVAQGQKSYAASQVTQKSLSGVFSKALLKYRF